LFSDELFNAVVDFIVAVFRETRDIYENTSNIFTQLITVDKHRRAMELLTLVYAGLVDTMISHLHYPEGSDPTYIFKGERVAENKFRDFRHEMGDVLNDCCRVVRGSACLSKEYFLVRQKLEDQPQHRLPVRWQEIEASLLRMRMLAREVDTEEVMLERMKLLVSLPEHSRVRYTATLELGRFTQWTAKYPQYLEFQLNNISSGFDNQSKDVISAAAQALKHFCLDCKKVHSTDMFTNISIWLIMLLNCFSRTMRKITEKQLVLSPSR
jgi:transportin-3